MLKMFLVFMELIKFEKNNVMTDYFWQVMVEKRCIRS
ncbi:hypothetical protein IIV6-T1_382 [Invertebrate iridescent virus 6]|nr:hypothetical protein IIV6-T1_382 [Invertebrate iridescent virus 6]